MHRRYRYLVIPYRRYLLPYLLFTYGTEVPVVSIPYRDAFGTSPVPFRTVSYRTLSSLLTVRIWQCVLLLRRFSFCYIRGNILPYVPMVKVNVSVGGGDDTMAMHKQNRLTSLLQAAGALL